MTDSRSGSQSERGHLKRVRLEVRGVVQGVGFRPFVARLANQLHLSGHVLNCGTGVIIEVQGSSDALNEFQRSLVSKAPALAHIETIGKAEIAVGASHLPQLLGKEGSQADFPLSDGNNKEVLPLSKGELEGVHPPFRIVESQSDQAHTVLIPPDVACCDECLAEVFDPTDRRHRYPFTTCLNCGPRFTLIQGLPYDRAGTTMAPFQMCPQCQNEFDNPDNRRYHVQPNACPICGPTLSLLDADGNSVQCADPILEVARLLKEGSIAAVKGLGGFHLACDATKPETVRLLRQRKGRAHKPLAVMFPDLRTVQGVCDLSPREHQELTSPRRPIVVLNIKPDSQLPDESSAFSRLVPVKEVAPGLSQIGVILPYTPLHEMLLNYVARPLVMTSGNLTEEPIVCQNDEALERLRGIADFFLVHDRDIAARCDDSVVRVWSAGTIVVRRSRGYVPSAIAVPITAPKSILALGAQLKSTFCLVNASEELHLPQPKGILPRSKGGLEGVTEASQALLSQHIGDLENLQALSGYEEALKHMLRLFNFSPEVIAHDLHPDFSTTIIADCYSSAIRIPVQHHHAHLAACLAENGSQGPAIGICWDGIGLGSDGSVWGAEFLVGDFKDFVRSGTFSRVPLPGADSASREPWRMALVYLREAFGKQWRTEAGTLLDSLSDVQAVEQMLDAKVNCPLGSSMGRLFDAVASLCLGIHRTTYEGQAAMMLEQAASQKELPDISLPCDVVEENSLLVVQPKGAFREAVALLERGVSAAAVARAFHLWLSRAAVQVCQRLRAKGAPNVVALSGGCLQNRLLLDLCSAGLTQEGFEVLTHKRVPPNDGGIALGQAVVAAEKTRSV